MNFIKSSLRYPAVTLTLVAMVCIAGIVSLLKMPRREDPKITIRAGLVMAFYPGASAAHASAAPGAAGVLPNTSTIVAATDPMLVKVCCAPPLRDSASPGFTSTGGSPSMVSRSLPVMSTKT